MKSKFLPILLSLICGISLQQSLAQNPCTQDTAFHIVVLGSSTAAGAGASPSDSSWVNRYRSYLQSLNPNYQVTNRAVGGFTTYRIMPTGYTPPSGRPDPDTTHNITYGIALNPDAIIVNLPSNDVSQGYSVAEQLENFDTIVNRAHQAGIPIWICTTQPKNYGNNPVPIQKQQDVRDSIWAKFSPNVLDFWSGIADSSNQLDSFFDSGDGTHLNNTGHYLLFTRARDTDIPAQLYMPPPYVDGSPLSIDPLFAPPCGDSLSVYELSFVNRGLDDNNPMSYSVALQELPNGPIQNSSGIVGPLNSCTDASVTWTGNTSAGGNYRMTVITSASGDPNASNDTLTYDFSTLGQPTLTTLPDTGCGNSSLVLQAFSQPGDSFRWFDAPTGGNFLAGGPIFQTPNLLATASYYVQAFRGDFVFKNSIATTTNNNIDFNGAMFDLVADSALVLDSFALKVRTLGSQAVVVQTKTGTHLGFETNSAPWSTVGTYPVNVVDIDSFVTIGPLNLNMNPGDTLGVYVSMQSSAARLGYQSMSALAFRSTDELTIITGSGSAFGFGGNFFPRDWNGEVFYHYGDKPDGDCQSERVEVEAMIGQPSVSLGNDTILNLTGSITLDAGPGFNSYLWSNGQSSQSITLDGNQLGTGVYTVIVQASDDLGCIASDTIIVVFAPLVGNDLSLDEPVALWPNPTTDQAYFWLPQGEWRVQLFDVNGKQVGEWQSPGNVKATMELQDLPAGLYWWKAQGPGQFARPLNIIR